MCFRKNSGIKKFLDRRGGGVGSEGLSTTSVESFLSHITEKVVKETLPCFTNFLVSNRFIDKMGDRKGVSVSFFEKNFLTVLKHFLEEPSSLSECFAYRIFFFCKGGRYDVFLSEICCLRVLKKCKGTL